MNYLRQFAPAVFVFGLLSCQQEMKQSNKELDVVFENSEQKQNVTELVNEALSPSFLAVKSNLDLGGEAFSYQEHIRLMQQVDAFSELLGTVIEKNEKDLKIDVKKLVQSLGVAEIRATGSSTAYKTGIYESRGFWHVPGEKKGLLSLMGQEKQEPLSNTYVPEGADLVYEQELDIRQLMLMVKEISLALPEEQRQYIDKVLETSLSPQATLKALLTNMKMRVLVAVEADPVGIEKSSELPQQVEGLILLKNAKLIWDNFKDLPQDLGLKIEERDGLKVITSPQPLPKLNTTPLLAYDEAKETLILVTSSEYLKRCLGKERRVTQSPDFQEILGKYGEKNNAMGYVSPQTFEIIKFYQNQYLKENEAVVESEFAKQNMESFKQFEEIFKELGNGGKGIGFSVQVNPDGFLFIYRGAGAPIQMSSTNVIVAATIVPMIYISARAWVDGANRAKAALMEQTQ